MDAQMNGLHFFKSPSLSIFKFISSFLVTDPISLVFVFFQDDEPFAGRVARRDHYHIRKFLSQHHKKLPWKPEVIEMILSIRVSAPSSLHLSLSFFFKNPFPPSFQQVVTNSPFSSCFYF